MFHVCHIYLHHKVLVNVGRYSIHPSKIEGPYQRTPKKVTRAMKYPGLGVRSVGPVGNFLEGMKHLSKENSFSPISFFHLFIEESGFSMIGAHADSLPGRE